ncbi:hypothetical protein GCM10022419_106370 [Nonomuraea rosea]|uniref:2TM domain-containing protein n=1 Tax=Nonomuraea rosea TaxID=638574 RepID=A0ABP6ZCH9_9ACTN
MKSKTSETARKLGLWLHLLCYVVANIAQVVVWMVYTPERFFWPLWSIIFWGIGLAFHVYGVYSPPKSNAAR